MSREQRVESNFGLSTAQSLAIKNNQKLFVVFVLSDKYLDAQNRHYSFMFDGLIEVEETLKELNIPFIFLTGYPPTLLSSFAKSIDSDTIVCDFDPLRIKQIWQHELVSSYSSNVYEVDSHNIVPCRVASGKKEFGAYTLRPKINKILSKFLAQTVSLQKHTRNTPSDFALNDFHKAIQELQCSTDSTAIEWLKSGEKAAKNMLTEFLDTKLNGYSQNRNDPNKDATSNLSPYLHFGQIYSGDIVKAVMAHDAPTNDKESFLEELIVRKELCDNFCFYESNYDNPDGFPEWAKKTIEAHKDDMREYIYSLEEFENADTHDTLWNAAQTELVVSGKMHGYMRMYWAKKILEWTPSADDAMKIAIYLNNRYALDGRDPNGYVGIAWSIGGVHDRAWFDRNIFGKIRYMNANGAKTKFDTDSYIKRWSGTKTGFKQVLSRMPPSLS